MELHKVQILVIKKNIDKPAFIQIRIIVLSNKKQMTQTRSLQVLNEVFV